MGLIVSSKDKKKENNNKGIFHTNDNLANYLYEIFKEYHKGKIDSVLDLCMGVGNLFKPFTKECNTFYGCDVEKDFVEYAKEHFKDYETHFKHDSIFNNPFEDKKFNCIVGNPPFGLIDKSIKKGYLDTLFLQKSFDALSDDGTLVVIQYPGILYRNMDKKELAPLIPYLYYVEWLQDESFFDDTSISVCILVLKKQKRQDKIKLKSNDLIEYAELQDDIRQPREKSKGIEWTKDDNTELFKLYVRNIKTFMKQQDMLMDLFNDDFDKQSCNKEILDLYEFLKKRVNNLTLC